MYEVTINEFFACKCLDFFSMKLYALGNNKKKWIFYKAYLLNFQNFLDCTLDDKYIHYLAYTFKEVDVLLERAETLISVD